MVLLKKKEEFETGMRGGGLMSGFLAGVKDGFKMGMPVVTAGTATVLAVSPFMGANVQGTAAGIAGVAGLANLYRVA